ncbi:hypothetical protein [Actinokineospora iranica]|uniref:hypothetical protein n=1 Tax=Actinokineospora iranica TaxID=1271860 RepID=UPI001113DCC7|nr:hypothetical protein [Actinokineospora iranica]
MTADYGETLSEGKTSGSVTDNRRLDNDDSEVPLIWQDAIVKTGSLNAVLLAWSRRKSGARRSGHG